MPATEAPTKQILMSDMFTGDNNVGVRRFKVSTATRQELQIASGEFFTGFSQRLNVAASPAGTVYYSVFKTAGKYAVIEDVTQAVDFSEVTDGHYNHKLQGFVLGSATSSFTYTPSNPLPAGRALSTEFINTFPVATIDLGVAASATGSPEYNLFETTFYIDTGGNRNTVSQSGSDFFTKGRQILIAPNSTVLIKSTTTGDATGSANITTSFFFSEISVDDAPTLLGI